MGEGGQVVSESGKPAVAPGGQPTAAPGRPARKRGRESAGDMVRSLVLVLVLVFVVVALTVRDQPDSPVREIDPSGPLAQARVEAGYDVLAPKGLPTGWRATSARTENGGADGTALVWRLGYLAPSDAYAGLAQSDGTERDLVDLVAEDGTAAGTVEIAGSTWRRVEGGDPEPRALVQVDAEVPTVVAGGASWAELRTLAAALRPD